MQIILVVFDKKSFQLSGQIVGEIDSYIDANYVRNSHKREYPVRSRRSAQVRALSEEAYYEEMLKQNQIEETYPFDDESQALAEPCTLLMDMSLENQLANMGASFHDKSFELIDASHR